MNTLLKSSAHGNGVAVNGRGLAHRKMSVEERIRLAADLAVGQVRLEPSLAQAAELCGVTTPQIRQELKARAEEQPDFLTLLVEGTAQALADQQAEAEHANEEADQLIAAWNATPPEAREAAVCAVGVDHVLDVIGAILGAD